MRRFVIEVGMGVDQHGQDNTRAAEKPFKMPSIAAVFAACARSPVSKTPMKSWWKS